MRILICSLHPEVIRAPRSYNSDLHIPAYNPKSGDKFAHVWIKDEMDYKLVHHDLQHFDKIEMPVRAQEIVNDLMGMNENIAQFGIWVHVEGGPDTVTDDEIAIARATRRNYLATLVARGDMEYASTKNIVNIPDFCKRAVQELGELRDWAFSEPPEKVQCEGCGAMVPLLRDGTRPAKCQCGAILDVEKAARLGLIPAPPPAAVSQQEHLRRPVERRQ